MRKFFLLLVAAFCCQVTFAQTKVFKQIAGSIKTDFSEIRQNRKVIGYVRLVQLGKTSKSDFSYEMNILDENLNDISTAKFEAVELSIADVAFEQDVICVNFLRGFKETELHFFSLDGKQLTTKHFDRNFGVYTPVINLPGLGFLYHHRLSGETSLLAMDPKGKKIWEKKLEGSVTDIVATSRMVGYYSAHRPDDEALNFINAKDGKGGYTKTLPIKNILSHHFTGIQVYNDTIYYSGYIAPEEVPGKGKMAAKWMKKNYQPGALVVKAWEPKKEAVKLREINWSDGSQADIRKRAVNPENTKETFYFQNSVTAADGTTYFYTENILRKPRIGNIAGAVILSPLLIPPVMFSLGGFNKYYVNDATIFKFTPDNKFRKLTVLPQKKSSVYFANEWLTTYSNRNMVNEEGTNPYFIGGDKENITLLNLSTKNTKQIPRRAGKISSVVYQAKDGHFMLVENNSETKNISLSIVPLQ